jgi:hypothetical protein
MKRILLLLAISPVYLFAQEISEPKLIKVEQSGVKVYEAPRAQPKTAQSTTSTDVSREVLSPEQALKSYDLVQCQEALSHVNAKISHLEAQGSNEESLKVAIEYKKLVLARIEELNSGK